MRANNSNSICRATRDQINQVFNFIGDRCYLSIPDFCNVLEHSKAITVQKTGSDGGPGSFWLELDDSIIELWLS